MSALSYEEGQAEIRSEEGRKEGELKEGRG